MDQDLREARFAGVVLDRICEDCDGTGHYDGKCVDCNGIGRVMTREGEELFAFISRYAEVALDWPRAS